MSTKKVTNASDWIDLQLFAEGAGTGGASGTAASAASGDTSSGDATGVKAADAAPQNTGVSTPDAGEKENAGVTPPRTKEEREAAFQAMINGEYKDLYDAEVKGIVRSRLAKSRAAEAKVEAMSPMLSMLAQKYGVKEGDIEALNRAITEDDSYYEREAMQRGISVQELKYIRKLEHENAEGKRRDEQMARERAERARRERADKQYTAWMREGETVKARYPSFDMKQESKNPQFMALLRSNIDVLTAYEVIHRDEIIGGAMQYAAKTVMDKLSAGAQAVAARPSENGGGGRSVAAIKSDVTKLTRAQRDELDKRIARGEKISFSP